MATQPATSPQTSNEPVGLQKMPTAQELKAHLDGMSKNTYTLFSKENPFREQLLNGREDYTMAKMAEYMTSHQNADDATLKEKHAAFEAEFATKEAPKLMVQYTQDALDALADEGKKLKAQQDKDANKKEPITLLSIIDNPSIILDRFKERIWKGIATLPLVERTLGTVAHLSDNFNMADIKNFKNISLREKWNTAESQYAASKKDEMVELAAEEVINVNGADPKAMANLLKTAANTAPPITVADSGNVISDAPKDGIGANNQQPASVSEGELFNLKPGLTAKNGTNAGFLTPRTAR